jgi:hypothetical protein
MDAISTSKQSKQQAQPLLQAHSTEHQPQDYFMAPHHKLSHATSSTFNPAQ